MNLVEMVQRDPAHIATRKNLQDSKKELLKWRHCAAKSQNLSKSLARNSHNLHICR